MRLVALALTLALAACPGARKGPAGPTAFQKEVQTFLDGWSARYRELYVAADEAEWAALTRIVEGDDTNAKRVQAAAEAKAAFVGSVENIETCRRYLERRDELGALQARQLEAILFQAANQPQTVPELVSARIAIDTAQSEKLYAHKYVLAGNELTTNDIDRMLEEETDVARRLAVWELSKEVGISLKPGLAEQRRLRNAVVQALGYHDFFTYMASQYGMTNEELIAFLDQLNRDLRPLYRELHTWARYELARRYGQPVPDLIPAHWLPNRWGQEWNAMVEVEGLDLDAALAPRGAEWTVRQSEAFYVSLGFESLPASFYERSSLWPVPPDAGYKKNNHASAWHLDLDRDVRSLMSVEPNARWYETSHHELGHIYYYLSYSRPEVPLVLRRGANPAFHEAIGSLMGFAAMQPRFVAAVGLAGSGTPDATMQLLSEALNYGVFIPFAAGTMSRFEHDLYVNDLPPEQWNARWWELAGRYQGIAPPSPRDERFCDACTKTHIIDDPAGYYDYALSFALLFQLHDHIARTILDEDPHDTNYFGRREVGDFLRRVMEPGATVDWRQLLQDTTGQQLGTRAMVEYFAPLMTWLEEQNRGRKHTLPEL